MLPMKTFTLTCFMLCLLVMQQAGAQEKYSKVQVFASSPEEKAMLIGLLQIDHFYEQDGAVVSEISATALGKLKGSKHRYKILVDDVARNLEMLNKKYFDDLANGRVAIEQSGSTVD